MYLYGGNTYIRAFNHEESKARRDIVCGSVNANLEKRRGRRFAEIDYRLACVMPSPASLKTSNSAEIKVTAYTPKHHLDEHPLVYLNEKLFHPPTPSVCPQKREWSSPVETRVRSPEPI